MVYIKTLNKQIFPYYIKPEKDEIFSSWLCRLSYNHKVKTNSFVANYFDRDTPVWNRDIDTSISLGMLEKFELHTPLDHTSLLGMTLRSYEGTVFESLGTSESNNAILPLGIHHRKRKGFGQQCCTSCLAKKIPYYRKQWRLASSIVCVECNQLLIDRCFSCQAPIAFFRINMDTNSSVTNFKPLYLCSNCGEDLRSGNPVAPSELELEYQRYINTTIELGYNNITSFSFLYLRGLTILAARLRGNRQNCRLKQIVQKKYNREIKGYPADIRNWQLAERKDTFPFIYDILKDYPHTISLLLSEGRLQKSYLIYGENIVPFWLQKHLCY